MIYNVYVDGFNLFYALREAAHRDPYYKSAYWLDLGGLASSFQNYLPDGWRLGRVKYFTAAVQTGESARNQAALETNPALQIIKGDFKSQETACRHAACSIQGYFTSSKEKMSDVALGVEALSDVLLGRTDGVVLITRDVDQVPTLNKIREVRPDIKRALLFPPGPHIPPHSLLNAATAHRQAHGFRWPKDFNTLARVLTCKELLKFRFPPELKGGMKEPISWQVSKAIRSSGPTLNL